MEFSSREVKIVSRAWGRGHYLWELERKRHSRHVIPVGQLGVAGLYSPPVVATGRGEECSVDAVLVARAAASPCAG